MGGVFPDAVAARRRSSRLLPAVARRVARVRALARQASRRGIAERHHAAGHARPTHRRCSGESDRPGMKIAEIVPWLIGSAGSYWGEFLFVEVRTDEGVTGWGEIT